MMLKIKQPFSFYWLPQWPSS